MSPPASDLPADTGSTIIEIPGQAALSSFRLRKLLDDLAAIDAGISGVDARYVYFIQLAAPLTRFLERGERADGGRVEGLVGAVKVPFAEDR